MKTKAHIFLTAVIVFICGYSISLYAQGQNQSSDANNPGVQVRVHKQTDANGNIISYDSTYTYIYSGKCHNDAYVDSLLKKYRGMDDAFFSVPLNTPDIYSYPFIQQFGVMDFDKMQEMLQNQMKEIMQIYGVPPCCNGFFCQPPPAHQCCPKDSVKYSPQPSEKKSCPKQNKAKGSVQI
ncbi:MAG: hypothetical protein ACLQQ4_04540 [Bacteroidia bacterium]